MDDDQINYESWKKRVERIEMELLAAQARAEEERARAERLQSQQKNSERHAGKFVRILSSVVPLTLFYSLLFSAIALVLIYYPAFVESLRSNVFGAVSLLVSVGLLIIAISLIIVRGQNKLNFVDIDKDSKASKQEDVELASYRDRSNEVYRQIISKLSTTNPSEPVRPSSEAILEYAEAMPVLESTTTSSSKNFEKYIEALIAVLDRHIEAADKKASLLLDTGMTYLWRGIYFYVVSIVVWQVVTSLNVIGSYAVWGIVSCSMTFLIVEFLAAWFLRQYKSYIDSSESLVRVRAVFNRYFLSYLSIKEFSDESHLVEMRAQMLKVLEEDVKWPESVPQKAGDINHMIAMFDSVTGLLEKLKVASKKDGDSSN
ncbi:hypothetical protein [Pseudomonas sp. BF-R-16]|uniref:hypothetical protein n=1 Tax=Pseudomonas sp. BF-R-16 TaxID=2832362 RepID=UPI001CBE05AA|nr:hypothetical protein [Pseudomonas sp. BF-R-16]